MEERLDRIEKLLQAVANGQSAVKDELQRDIKALDEKICNRIDDVERNLTARMDRLGKELAVVDDDAVSREDFEELDKRVTGLEQGRIAL